MIRILIIDDDACIREVLRDTLESAGYDVREACNGKEGLHQYRAMPADLVITDLCMPEQDGFETITALHCTCATVKVIVISGAAQHWLERAKQCGAHRVLTKPFRPQELCELVHALVAGQNYVVTT